MWNRDSPVCVVLLHTLYFQKLFFQPFPHISHLIGSAIILSWPLPFSVIAILWNCSPQPEKNSEVSGNCQEGLCWQGLEEMAEISNYPKAKEGKAASPDYRKLNAKASITDIATKQRMTGKRVSGSLLMPMTCHRLSMNCLDMVRGRSVHRLGRFFSYKYTYWPGSWTILVLVLFTYPEPSNNCLALTNRLPWGMLQTSWGKVEPQYHTNSKRLTRSKLNDFCPWRV